jgi:hypothetical protein
MSFMLKMKLLMEDGKEREYDSFCCGQLFRTPGIQRIEYTQWKDKLIPEWLSIIREWGFTDFTDEGYIAEAPAVNATRWFAHLTVLRHMEEGHEEVKKYLEVLKAHPDWDSWTWYLACCAGGKMREIAHALGNYKPAHVKHPREALATLTEPTGFVWDTRQSLHMTFVGSEGYFSGENMIDPAMYYGGTRLTNEELYQKVCALETK